MAESTITAKGRTTVPADIRALVDARTGMRLVWSAMPDGTIIVRAKAPSILDMAGMLEAPEGKHLSVNDMNPRPGIRRTSMPALDTKVLVRHIVQDDAARLTAAKPLISRCVGGGPTLFVPVTVVLELEWVPRSCFEIGKDDVPMALSSLFPAAELPFESERALRVALPLFRKGSADFADCLAVALATQAGEHPPWAFEKGAAWVSGAARPLTQA